jgi:hypothetical protein
MALPIMKDRREQPAITGGNPMTLHAPNHDLRPSSKEAQAIPAFKPVALPALAAAMRSAKHRPAIAKKPELPAILRKEAMLGR